MNVARIKNPFVRRLHLVWIVPYLVVILVPYIVIIGCKEVIPDWISTWGDLPRVWTGKQ